MSELNQNDPPAPWSYEALLHRVTTLEQIIIRHEARMNHFSNELNTHIAEVSKLSETHEATLQTLQKMQETLELMKEVLVTYNKAKGVFAGFNVLGAAVISFSKFIVGAGILYAVIHYGKLP